ncbi:hypothetical protein N7457_001404 [Penicillium paradoxum]|uniref:uncharacterized protein n=1 Tax=Penicillium paradoxum TaxID=176176 RepID=UPI002548A228|nr:uncharacterized protein N7457_001404 [Penicillium paradoxum]KAJ5794805.1 hypothetical protein N7457_001404 [Penicillium paradoxum]
MLQLNPAKLTLLLSLLASSTFAKDGDLSSDLVGCDEVSCPKEGVDDRCTVDGNTFLGIGLSRIPDVPSALDGFSLVKGVNVSAGLGGKDNDKPTRPFRSVYYLGAPSDANTKDLSGCVVIFNDAPSKKFDGPQLEGGNRTDTRAASGTCSDVIDQKCIDKLTERATKVGQEGGSKICSSLEQELKKFSLNECNGFAGNSDRLGDFTVKQLDDLEPIPKSEGCWPIKPDSDQLLEIASVKSLRNYSANALIDEAYKITPVLTLFTKGNDSLVNTTVSQLTCLKVVTKEDPEDDKDSGKNSAMALKGSGLAAGIAALMAGMVALL